MKPKNQSPVKLVLVVLLVVVGLWIVVVNIPSSGCPAGAISDQKGGCDQCPLMDAPSTGNWFCKDSQFYPQSYEGCIDAGYPNLKKIPASCEVPEVGHFWEGGVNPTVTNFQQCADAGYPVMESYPRQCRTVSGLNFVEEVKITCNNSYDCQTDQYCQNGTCVAFSPVLSCITAEDCGLINRENRFGCCYKGECSADKYNGENWIAVNIEWYLNGKAQYCPPANECGPSIACAIVPNPYTATCQNNVCQKTIPHCQTTLPLEEGLPDQGISASELYNISCALYGTKESCETAQIEHGCQWIE
ncbi:MAG: hypothetical protein AABW68_02560 [archaeon]